MRKFGRVALRLLLMIGLAFVGVGLVASPSSAFSPGVSFGAKDLSTWQTDNVVYDLASAQGRVFAGGAFTQLRPPTTGSGTAVSVSGLAVLNAATGAPTSCQYSVGGTSRVRAVIASADGSTVYIAGEFSTVNGYYRGRVAALDVANCSVRTQFSVNAVNAEVFGLALHDNVLYLAGGFSSVDNSTRQYFAAVNATTGALLPWAADGQSFTGAPVDLRGRAVAVSPDGTKVVVGGNFYYINGTFSHSIAIVTGADAATGVGGTLLRTYPQGFIPGDPNATSTTSLAPSGTSVTHVIISGDDGRFYIGNEGTGGGIFDGRAAFSWDTGDQVWRDTCLGATQDLLLYGGTLYSASHAHDCTSNDAFQDGKRNYFLAENANTGKLIGWGPTANDGTGEGIGPRALTLATNPSTGAQYLWAAGEFTLINGAAQQGLTRFSTTDNAAPSAPAIASNATSDGRIQVVLRSSVDADDSELTYSLYRGSSTTPIATTTASSVWWKRPQVTLVDPSPVAGQLNIYKVTVSDGVNTVSSGSLGARSVAPSNDYAATVRSDSPTLQWSGAHTGTFLYDTGASSDSGTRQGGLMAQGVADSTDSPIPGDTASMSFDGSNDYVWNDNWAPAPATYSIETWIKTTTTRGGKIVGYGNGRPNSGSGATVLSSSYDRQVYMTNAGKLVFGAYTGSAVTLTSPASYNDGIWHHVVATQGASGMALYVDGRRVGSNTNSVAQSYMGVWHVGGDQLNGWPSRPSSNYFAGLIDETAIYGTVLSQDQVLAHALAGGLAVDVNPAPADAYGQSVYSMDPTLYWRLNEDSSTNTAADSAKWKLRPGTYNGTVTRGTAGVVPGNSAVTTLGNTNSTVGTSASGDNPSTYSVQVWFNTTTTSGGKLAGIENTQTGNGSSYDKNLYMTNSGNLVFGTYVSGFYAVTSPGTYNDGAWHMATATQDSSGIKLYVDGVLVASNTQANSESFVGYWRIGGGNLSGWPSAPSSFYFGGSLDEFAVYPVALSAAAIQSQYQLVNPDTTPPTTPGAVTATPNGVNVDLAWSASSDNSGVTQYRVYRGVTADFVADNASLYGTTTGLTYADVNVAPGTWYYKVAAVDAAGNVSAASDSVPATMLDTVAPTAPTASVVANGSDVEVSWSGASDDVAVTGYSVYRGASADFVADDASKLADLTGTSYTDVDPGLGTFFYKVVAHDAAGNSSTPSDAVAISIADSEAPSTPGSLAAVVSGTDVSLTWDASTDNVGVTGYSVYRGTSAGFTPSAANLLGTVGTPGYTDSNRPAGTWYYVVTAFDAVGNVSDATAAVPATIPDTTAPSQPGDLAASVGSSSVTLTWTASSDDVGVTGYAVYRGSDPGFTPAAGNQIADVTTTGHTDSGLAVGTYYYKVQAHDAAGNLSSVASVSATVEAPPTEPATVLVDPSQDAGVYASAPNSNYGTGNQYASKGTSAPQQSFLEFALPDAPAGQTLTGAVLELRTSNDSSAGSADSHRVDIMSGSWSESTITYNNRPTTQVVQVGTITGASSINTAFTVDLTKGALASRLGSAVTLRLSSDGSDNLRVWSKEVSTSSYRPVLRLEFEPTAGPDTEAPTEPGNFQASVSGQDVDLSWSASSDNVGVVEYRLFRGDTSDFTPSPDNRISIQESRTFADNNLDPGSYYYKVRAYDAAGNASSAASTSATVEAAPVEPVTTIVTTSADAAVAASTPTVNYGTNTQLFARGSSAQESFLSFTIPDAPSGLKLTGATLKLRTSTDPTATSIDDFAIDLTSGSWNEDSITWNNRPTDKVGSTLGTLAGAAATNTAYTVTLDASSLASRVGQTVTIRISGSGSDNVRLWSKEASTSSYRPSITFDYTPA